MIQTDHQATANQHDLSVLIVNYNVKDYLVGCLRSVLDGIGGLSVQIVVVDNHSSDNSVEELQPIFPSVEWIALEKNIGFGRANNAGMVHCTGRRVLFLNPDTIIGHDTLSTMVEYLDAHPDVGLAGCKVLNPDGTFQVACRRGLPTPWASFCKLFGLQSLFPKSRLFARYNLTYLDVDDTYEVDALIGAFMVGPRALINSAGGFDPQFFMYGEDLDLCYRIQCSGSKIMYVHTTNIVHFKGESTKRSSMNEVRVFYDAMELFAKKHFGGSPVFLGFMKLGIGVRSVFERLTRRLRDVMMIIVDMLSILLALLIATTVRFDSPFGFPDYAYPTVLIVVPLVALLSLLSMGEYVEYRPSLRRSLLGLFATFFLLSSMTYFVKEFAFSRGVVLMTVGLSAVFFAISRGLVVLFDTLKGSGKKRRIMLVGINEASERIAQELSGVDGRNTDVIGVVRVAGAAGQNTTSMDILGTTDYLDKIIESAEAKEVIFTDPGVSQAQVMSFMTKSARLGARFHLATEYDDIVTARIINDVVGVEPTVSVSPLMLFRNKVVKRLMDLIIATLSLPFVAIRLSLGSKKARGSWSVWTSILKGTMSVVGLYPDEVSRPAGKLGRTSFVHLSDTTSISEQSIKQLNDYYVDQYSLSLDIEIIIKHLLR